MGLFSKKRIENSIFDVLFTNIKTFREEDFTFIGIKKNTAGDEYKHYTRTLPYSEQGLFQIEEVIVFSEHEANIFFKSKSFNIDINKLRCLVDKLHSIYGKDSLNYSRFSDYDIHSIRDNKFWSGRMWTNCDPDLTMSAPGKFNLAILGVKINMAEGH